MSPGARHRRRPEGRRLGQPVVGAIAGRELAAGDAVAVAEAVAVAVAVAEAFGAGERDVTGEVEGTSGRDGTPSAVGTGMAEDAGVGALPSRSVQVVPSQVHVSPATSPAADVDPRASPPKSTTWPVAGASAMAGWARGGGASGKAPCGQAPAGLVETHNPPVASRPTTSPAAVSVTGGTSK